MCQAGISSPPRRPIPRRGVAALAALNIGWVVASLDYAFLGGLTTIGVAWTVLQAVVVGVFALGIAFLSLAARQ